MPNHHIHIEQLSDIELVLQYKSTGDHVFFAELYQRYTHLVLGTCFKYLKNEAEKEKYFDDFRNEFAALQNKLQRDKSQDIYLNKKEISELLENEIVSRYYFQKGRIEADFNHDPDILKATEILQNPTEYNSILTAKK